MVEMKLFYFAAIELGHGDAPNRHTLELCNHLAQRGHRIWLFVPFRRLPSTDLHPNVRLVSVPVLYGFGTFLRSLSFRLALPLWSWRRFLRLRPDVVYVRTGFLDWIAIAPLRLLFDFVHVGEWNGIRSLETPGGRLKRLLIAWQERVTLRLSDKVIGVAPELCEWAIATGQVKPDQTAAIGNGVPTDLFAPMPLEEARSQLDLETDRQYLTFTSTLKPWHDTASLIRALPDILEQWSGQVHLLVVGDGPERERLVRLADELGVNHAIRWVGRVPADRVPLYINASEVCLAPFPAGRDYFSAIKVFEYMGCARPFVTTQLGAAFDELVKDCQCGILVPPGDPAALAAAVLRLLCDPELRARLGSNGRRAALERYSWAKVAERTEQFIQEPPLSSQLARHDP
jgi:glycosyltransferase involved in cell wall biosynthesis